MAYAVAGRVVGQDGSQESHWFNDFQRGDTGARRSRLQALIDADPRDLEIVEFADKAAYDAAVLVATATDRGNVQTEILTLRTNYLSFRTKFAALMRSTQVDNILAAEGETPITVAELRAFERVILKDL